MKAKDGRPGGGGRGDRGERGDRGDRPGGEPRRVGNDFEENNNADV